MMICFFLTGLYVISVRGSSYCWHSRETRPCLGSQEHGLRTTEKGIQSQVPDQMYTIIPKQAGLCAQFYRR